MRSRFLSPGVRPHDEHICIGRSADGAGNSGRRSGRTGCWRGLLKDEEEFSRQEAGSRVWNQKVMGVSEQGCRGGQVEFSIQVETKVIKVTRQSGWQGSGCAHWQGSASLRGAQRRLLLAWDVSSMQSSGSSIPSSAVLAPVTLVPLLCELQVQEVWDSPLRGQAGHRHTSATGVGGRADNFCL